MKTPAITSGAVDTAPHRTYSRPQFGTAGPLLPKTARAAGFTLIELVVVMALIGLMVGFATPQLRSTLFENGAKKASRWFMVTIPAIKSKAVREQKVMALGVSLDQDKVWVVDPQPSPKPAADGEDEDQEIEDEDVLEEAPAKQKIFELPSDVHIMDVEFPDQDRISVGETEIYFYNKGYSDHAIIHMEDSDGNRYSFMIEPFLPSIRRIDDYVSF